MASQKRLQIEWKKVNPMIDPMDSLVLGPVELPSEEEMKASAAKRWDMAADVTIDQWPEEITALSVPSILIPIDTAEMKDIYDPDNPNWVAAMDKYSKLIDEAIGWEPHFVRLSTRSPKDVAYPGLPITMSGKQAMDWISNSERCMDDLWMAHMAGKPIFIALRKLYRAPPGGEFRCFAKDGKLIAVSRYDYHQEAQINYKGWEIFKQLSDWYDEKIAMHYPTVVFDVELGAYDHEGPLLIEANPYGLSHPCLFEGYDDIENNGGFRA